MRKLLFATTVAVLVAGGMPIAQSASATCDTSTTTRECSITFNAAVPTTLLAPYNTTDYFRGRELTFSTCENPSPPAIPGVGKSWDDYTLTIPTNGSAPDFNLATFEISPKTDYDSFVCEVNDTANENGISNEVIATGANEIGGECDGVLGPNDFTGIGCHESVTAPVQQGVTYRFRVYNWSDVATCPGKVILTHVDFE